MSQKRLLYIAFFTFLAVGFYFVISAVVPGFARGGSPPVSFVRPFSFTNQDGKPVTDKDVKGKVYVASYFFTTCTSICPTMNGYLKDIYEKFKNEPDFMLLSHTCMPDVDSVPLLKKYQERMQVDGHKWIFLTGRKDSLYNMARVSYTIDDPNDNLLNLEDDFLHTQFWALVDRNGDVRKIYDGLKTDEIKQLEKDIAKYLKRKN
jgi:protein SCO1/2